MAYKVIDFETAMDAINADPWSICNISDESVAVYEKYMMDASSTFLNPNWDIHKKNTDIPEDWFQPGFVWVMAQSWCPEDYDPDEIAKDNIIKFFKLLDEEWQSMPTFICQVARWNPKLLAHINQDLLQNYEMVAALVLSNGDCLKYLEERLKTREMFLLSVHSECNFLEDAIEFNSEFAKDEEFILAAFNISRHRAYPDFSLIHDDLLKNKEFIKKLISVCPPASALV